MLHHCQVVGIKLKKGLILPFIYPVMDLRERVYGTRASSVLTIESVSDVCCDATLTFAGLPGKVCKQFTATVVRMQTNYEGSAATPLFAH